MKTLMLGSLLMLTACSPTLTSTSQMLGPVIAIAAVMTAPKPQLPKIFPAGYDAAEACSTMQISGYGNLEYQMPARFPNPAETKLASRMMNYFLNCPTYTINHPEYAPLEIVGLSVEDLDKYMDDDEDRKPFPYIWEIDDNTRLDLRTPGVAKVTQIEEKPFREDRVIAIKQGNSQLQSIAFNGVATEVHYNPSLPVEIFAKNMRWSHLTWKPDTKTFRLELDTKFPSN